MASRPLVSVIVPAYNASRFIRAALQSALDQAYTHIEVIVVDDGSEDATPDIVREVAARDERVRLIRQANRGVARARNTAIAEARGTYVAPLDADDLWFPHKIERQVACLEQAGPAAGLAYTWWVSIDEEGHIRGTAPQWNFEGDVLEALTYVNFIGNASVPLMRRACVEEVGGYNEELQAQGAQGCEDWDLALRIAERRRVRVVPAYLSAYRGVQGSMSNDTKAMGRSYDLVVAALKRRNPELPDEVVRWSRSNFYKYLADLSYAGEDYAMALHWLRKIVALDPSVLLSPTQLKLVAKSLALHAVKPLMQTIWPSREARLALRRRLGGRSRPVMDADELNGSDLPETFGRRRWSPHGRACRRRWAQVTHSDATCAA